VPITEFQREVLALLKLHRNPNSYVAGGIAIHRSDSSTRHSNDIDFFHDTEEAVFTAAKHDRNLLAKNGYSVETVLAQPSFIRAVVSKNNHSLKLEWARDTAFRFFPVIEDELLGYRLHDVDLATNKCLALANRNEVRDIIDLVQIHEETLSLTATCWAACGKDPGFTPALLIDCMRRHSIIRSENLSAESLTIEISAPELKIKWLTLLDTAAMELEGFSAKDLGCLFLNYDETIVHSPLAKEVSQKHRHFGTIGGSWPKLIT